MAARMRTLQASRLFKSFSSTSPTPRRLLPIIEQASAVQPCAYTFGRNSSTDSFSWSVGSEPGASKGAPSQENTFKQEPGAYGGGASEGFKQQAQEAPAGGASQEKRKEEAKSEYEEEIVDEKTQVLRAAMAHVTSEVVQPRLGWMDAALVAGARDAGLSPSIVGSFPRKDAALVEFFMDECNHKLHDKLEELEKEHSAMLLADRIAAIVRMRLEMQIPVISKWAQALSIQANPLNAPQALKQRAMLVDDIWHAAGDRSADMDWYTKRALLGAVYTATELYMLTDFSAGHRDTWTFLERRIKDAVNCRKTAQEATHLAQAVSMGLSNSVTTFFNKGFQSPKF